MIVEVAKKVLNNKGKNSLAKTQGEGLLSEKGDAWLSLPLTDTRTKFEVGRQTSRTPSTMLTEDRS